MCQAMDRVGQPFSEHDIRAMWAFQHGPGLVAGTRGAYIWLGLAPIRASTQVAKGGRL